MGLAWLTFGVGSVGDSQGSRVGVDAIRNHAVEDPAPSRGLVTCQQPYDPRVVMVELPEGREDKLWSITRTCGLRPFPSGDAAAISIKQCLAAGCSIPYQTNMGISSNFKSAAALTLF